MNLFAYFANGINELMVSAIKYSCYCENVMFVLF